MAKKHSNPEKANAKLTDLAKHTEQDQESFLTTNQGLCINDDQNSLKTGERGPTLMEDFIFREKITHFNHERIPERVVHARGSGAHGIFECTKSMSKYTKAKFLQTPGTITPVFARFSTVAGSRGSTDLARDVRGFAVKFYTEEGNNDLVGNNMPVFFIQDAIKFPDLIHAVKPEPHNEIPQAASAHDTFWDFVSLSPETLHNVMWLMSDRAIPRSLRMMEGFGIHTYRFVNANNESFFVKFHWKPLLGVHSVLWDEAQKISGKDSDFHRRDLYEAIEAGAFAQWDFGVQIVEEKDEHKFDFDLLDPTKLIPEELVPVEIIGRMTLNRNPDNFFAETEQVAFHPGHVVPGIDFTNDPLLQGRLFSYTDTQLIRLGGPNFHEIPINRPIASIHNNQRDGYMRQMINPGQSSYNPNSTGNNAPYQTPQDDGGYTSYHERIDGRKIRGRSESFFDFFSQPAMFYHSQSEAEQNHIVDAFRFELGKVKEEVIRKRVVSLLVQIDKTLAKQVADGLGFEVPKPEKIHNHAVPPDVDPMKYQSRKAAPMIDKAPSLSMADTVKDTIKSRKVAIIANDGADANAITTMQKAIEGAGGMTKVIALHEGSIKCDGIELPAEESYLTAASVLFDAVYLPGGKKSVDALKAEPDILHFISEAYKHCKAIAADDEGVDLLKMTAAGEKIDENMDDVLAKGIVLNQTPEAFMKAIARHRFWVRQQPGKVPA